MKYLACVLLLGSFVYIESLNPRSVNVALETVLEFDGKHSNRDVKAIDKLQNYLTRIKKIIYNNDDSRRHLAKGYKFRDFLKSTFETISSYDDNDLLDVVAIANNEIRKYHYKGCRFHELVENHNMRRDMAEKLVSLNELPAKELRTKMNTVIQTLENDAMADKKTLKMLDYLDSVYVGDDIQGKMDHFLAQLDQFKQRSKRANLNLAKVINAGLRSIIFDYYTDLNVNARAELRTRLESFWQDYKSSDNLKHDRDKENINPTANVKIYNVGNLPKKDILRSKPERKKTTKKGKLHLEPIYSTDIKKYKRTTQEYPTKEETRDARERKHKKYLRHKKYKISKGNKEKKVKKSVKSTSNDMGSPEDVPPILVKRLIPAKDSIEVKKRLDKRKGKHRDRVTEAMILPKGTRRSNDYEEAPSEEGLHIQSFEKHRLKSRKHRDEINDPAPNVMHKMDNIEKVLEQIKDLVSMQQRRKSFDEEDIIETTKTTPKVKETEQTTVTPKLTTQISSPVTETTTTRVTTTQKTTTKPTKPIIVEEFTKSTKMTTEIKSKPESDEDTKIISDKYTSTTKNLPQVTTTTTETEKSTTATPEIKSTVKMTATLPSDINNEININNDTFNSEDDKLRPHREVKEENLTDLDIEKIYNETRRSGLHDVVHGNGEEDRELNRRVKDRIAGHMKRFMTMTVKDGQTTRFDFSLDDPFGFKDDLIL